MHSRNSLLVFFLTALISSCAVMTNRQVNKSIETSTLLDGHFTGFALYDPSAKDYLVERNADKYFTPASTTKLFTFFAGLKILEDSVPGLKYVIRGDSLIFWGTGDPSFLHPDFEDQPVFDFLQKTDKKLFYAVGNFQDAPFGSGWAWDDYSYYFQPERSAMPIYGNTVNFSFDSLKTQFILSPDFFESQTEILSTREKTFFPNRNSDFNIFQYYPNPQRSNRKNRVPFKTSDELLVKLLADTLNKSVRTIPFQNFEGQKTIHSRRANELYAWILKASDNFISEQLLYLCASQISDTLNSAKIRAHITKKHLSDLPSPPVWKDGSGLSRYNLFTPRSMIMLLEKMKKELPEEVLFALLPAGGVDGTIKNWYASESGQPYIFAKTGTLSNNHNLCGFIRTKSGQLLTFSFMNNNYNSSSVPIKKEMEKVLKLVWEKY